MECGESDISHAPFLAHKNLQWHSLLHPTPHLLLFLHSAGHTGSGQRLQLQAPGGWQSHKLEGALVPEHPHQNAEWARCKFTSAVLSH